jgi:hypothetical protein
MPSSICNNVEHLARREPASLTKNVLSVRPASKALSQDADNKRRTNPACGVWVGASLGASMGITGARTRIKLVARTIAGTHTSETEAPIKVPLRVQHAHVIERVQAASPAAITTARLGSQAHVKENALALSPTLTPQEIYWHRQATAINARATSGRR